jgi:hypothetical protein
MFANSPALRLAQLLSERARQDHNFTDPTPSALAQFIGEQTALSPSQATAVVWGEEADYTRDEVETLAALFKCDTDLMSALLLPCSDEGIEHSLLTISTTLDVGECPFCDDLAIAIGDIKTSLHSTEDLQHLAVDVLAHTGTPEPFGMGYEDFGDEIFDDLDPDTSELDPIVNEILYTAEQLPHEALRRVLLYAHHEVAQLEQRSDIIRIANYARLKEQMTPLARRVFDALAAGDIPILRAELMRLLDLDDARALGQLTRSVRRAVDAASQNGATLPEFPLVFDRKNGTYALTTESRQAWNDLRRAEQVGYRTSRSS